MKTRKPRDQRRQRIDAANAGPPGETATEQRPPRHRHGRGDQGGNQDRNGPVVLFGIHTVDAALRNPARSVDRLLLTSNARHRLAAALAQRSLDPEPADAREIDRLAGEDSVHQGACLVTRPLEQLSLDSLAPEHLGEDPLVVVLDQVTDPHNVGAILRSAAAFGAAAVVMTDRNSPPLAGTLAKAASGALDLIPVMLVANLARGLGDLRDLGYHLIGLDGEATDRLDQIFIGPHSHGPHVIVLGAEEQGLRRLTRDTCDRLASLATQGRLRSLNVSNAAAVALSTIRLSQARAGR